MKRFWYMASTYTVHPGGHEAAFQDAAKGAAMLVDAGVHIFSPIAHSHPISEHMAPEKNNHDTWLDQDDPLMDAAFGIIILGMPNWEKSKGIAYEREVFAGRTEIIAEWPLTKSNAECIALLCKAVEAAADKHIKTDGFYEVGTE